MEKRNSELGHLGSKNSLFNLDSSKTPQEKQEEADKKDEINKTLINNPFLSQNTVNQASSNPFLTN